jgi:hypothetical protein
MQLVKLITPKIIKSLYGFRWVLLGLLSTSISTVSAQDNSPYSRYGIGDLVPPTHIIGRSMGGVSAGYSDFLSINFNNPASYSSFQAILEQKSNKIISGRAILDIGLNFENRTITEPFSSKQFVANNALFSYVNVGVPLRKNMGLSFGLRPISRISYKMIRNELLFDPITGNRIDSAVTRFEGDGGAYLASIGTGMNLFRKDKGKGLEQKLSVGVTAGYLFGKKDYKTKRSIFNDTVEYYQANFETRTAIGDFYFNAGMQYKMPIDTSKNISLTIGAFGNWKQKIKTSQDIIRETFVFDEALGEIRLDSVYENNDNRGELIYPSSFTVGFIVDRMPVPKKGGWLIGVDFTSQNWDQYRFYGQKDSVKSNWELRMGGQFRPAAKRNYLSNVAYRAGFFTGPDYIKIGQKMTQYGFSFGLGLPVANYRSSYSSANQATIINLALEYSKRGDNNNLLRENMFRLSLGFSLSDFWFIKRKYD